MRAFQYIVLVLVAGFVTNARAAGADDKNVYLAQAKVFYQGLEFEKCVQRLEQAARMPDNTREVLAQVELYNGLCLVNLSKRDEAESHFNLALQLDPDVTLPAGTSPRIAKMFEPLAARARANRPERTVAKAPPATQDAPRERKLTPEKEQAPNPAVGVETERGGSKVLPIALGGTAVAAGAVGAIFGVMAKGHEAQANDPKTMYPQAVELGRNAQGEATAANVAFAVAGTAAAGALISWWLMNQ